jgi:CRISPR type I-E-associated protein CasB/Cse2
VKQGPHKQHPLIIKLHNYVRNEERGPLAELRRGALNWPNCDHQTIRHVAEFFTDKPNRVREDAMLLVATMYAMTAAVSYAGDPSDTDNSRSIAETLRATIKSEDEAKRVENRFVRLLGADSPETIAIELRHAVKYIDSRGEVPGWQRLLADVTILLGSDDEKREHLKRQWSRDFWAQSYCCAT